MIYTTLTACILCPGYGIRELLRHHVSSTYWQMHSQVKPLEQKCSTQHGVKPNPCFLSVQVLRSLVKLQSMSNTPQGSTKPTGRVPPAAAPAQAVATEALVEVDQRLQPGAAADPTTVLKEQAEQYLQDMLLPMEKANWQKVGPSIGFLCVLFCLSGLIFCLSGLINYEHMLLMHVPCCFHAHFLLLSASQPLHALLE